MLARWLVAEHLCKIFMLVAYGGTIGSIIALTASRQALDVHVDTTTVRSGHDLSPPAADASGLLHFVQVSDTHLAPRDHPEWVEKFRKIMMEDMAAINPTFVLHTGDMVEAKEPLPTPFLHAEQLESEWKLYAEIVNKSGWFDPTRYIDMRGNHDSASVPSRHSKQNLFNEYGVSASIMIDDGVLGAVNPRPVRHSVAGAADGRVTTTQLRFIVLDLAPSPGLSLPYNTQGMLSDEHAVVFDQLLAASPSGASVVRSQDSVDERYEVLLVASHYPTMFMREHTFADIMESHSVSAYLTGHYHQPHMWSRVGRQGGVLQLEVDDVFESSAYRLLAVDHGMMNFADTTIDSWPLVLVTNPKDARFLMEVEPNDLTHLSTHIRVLAFSPAGVNGSDINVTVSGESVPLCGSMEAVDDYPGLFTCPWNPMHFAPSGARGGGTFTMRVTVTDGEGRTATTEHPFSVDGTGAPLGTTFAQWASNVCLPCAYSAHITLAWFLILVVGLGFGYLWSHMAARYQPRRLDVWRNKIDSMRRVEFACHSSTALSHSFPHEATTFWRQVCLYGAWNVNRHMWRFSELPTWVGTILLIDMLWMFFLPIYFGPFVVAGDDNWGWGVAFWWGVVGGDGTFHTWEIVTSLFLYSIGMLSTVALALRPADAQPIGMHLGPRRKDRVGGTTEAAADDHAVRQPEVEMTGVDEAGLAAVVFSKDSERSTSVERRHAHRGCSVLQRLGSLIDCLTPPIIRRCRRAYPRTSNPASLGLMFLATFGRAYTVFMLGDGFMVATAFLSPLGIGHLAMEWALLVNAVKRDGRAARAAAASGHDRSV